MEAGFWIVIILVRVILGAVAAAIASSKGRSTVGWFFGGFFLDVIAIIIVAVLPNLKEQERRRTEAMAERRRLREQLRQEKMKTEAFRQHAAGRLDAHDRLLGVDTRDAPALAGPAHAPRLAAAPPPPDRSRDDGRLWYYARDGQSMGPVPFPALRSLVERGEVTASTLVWTEGQTDWLPAAQVGVLQAIVGGA